MIVIEYGHLVDQDDRVLVPGLLDNTPYLFNITSVPQRGLNNNTFAVPAGAVVGGGTAVNGMFFDRGSAPDYDAWVKLGNPGWGWKDLLPYFEKVDLPFPPRPILIYFFVQSENFTPPGEQAFSGKSDLRWDENVHGSDGPVQSSYPVFQYPSISKVLPFLGLVSYSHTALDREFFSSMVQFRFADAQRSREWQRNRCIFRAKFARSEG